MGISRTFDASAGTTFDEIFVDDPAENEARIALDEQGRVREIKEIARQAIVDIAPEWKQRNLLARTLELVEKQLSGLTLTVDEAAELAQNRATWQTIKNIRAASDLAEANGTTPADFDPYS